MPAVVVGNEAFLRGLAELDVEQLLSTLGEIGPFIQLDEEAARLLSVVYVKHLVDSGRMREARRLLELLDREHMLPDALTSWAVALGRPQARADGPGRAGDPSANAAWLRKHAASYGGQWVALRDGELVASDTDRRAIQRRIGGRDRLRDVAFFRVPG